MLFRCFVMGIIVLVLCFVVLSLAGGLAFNVNGKIVPISLQQLDIVNLAGLLMIKLAIFVLSLYGLNLQDS